MSSSASAGRGGTRGYAYYVLFLLFLVTVMNYFDRSVLNVLQEPVKHDLGLQDTQLGIVSGVAFALLYAVSGIPIARIADRSNRPGLLGLVLGFWSIMSAACGLAQSFLVLALCRMGVGMGESGSMPTAQSLIADYFPIEQRGMAMATISAGAPIAALLAPIIGGIVAHTWGWRTAFFVAGAPGLVLAPVIAFSLREPRTLAEKQAAKGHFFADLKWFKGQWGFWALTLGAGFNAMGTVGLAAFQVSYLVRQYHLGLPQAGTIAGLMGLVGLAGSLSGGYLADRFNPLTGGKSYFYVPVVGAILPGILYLIAFQAQSWPLFLTTLLLAGMTLDMKNGPTYAIVQGIAPLGLRATASSLFMFGATGFGSGFGPLSIGLVSDHAAQAAFGARGVFSVVCKGGHAAAGAPADLAKACVDASSLGLHSAVIAACGFFFVGAGLYFLASIGAKRAVEAPGASTD